MHKPRIRKYGENAILIEFEAVISSEINDRVLATSKYLTEHHSELIVEIVPSYQSIVVFLKDGVDIDRYLAILLNGKIANEPVPSNKKKWLIPVCYSSIFALDLHDLINLKNLTHEELIILHSEPDYRIYGIGFLPGFLYLGGLNERLYSARTSVVKRFVPKGSVAIGGKQTGIYPQESPGGWNVIGRTPIDLFNPTLNPPSPFSIGDSIRFYSIDASEYEQIESDVLSGKYELKPLPND